MVSNRLSVAVGTAIAVLIGCARWLPSIWRLTRAPNGIRELTLHIVFQSFMSAGTGACASAMSNGPRGYGCTVERVCTSRHASAADINNPCRVRRTFRVAEGRSNERYQEVIPGISNQREVQRQPAGRTGSSFSFQGVELDEHRRRSKNHYQ